MHSIHVSDITNFLKCRRAWNWSSAIRDNLEAAKPYAPFYVGRAIHYCIEENILHKTPYEDSLDAFVLNERNQMGGVPADEIFALEENLDLVSGMLRHYDLTWGTESNQTFANDKMEFLNVELEFTVPLGIPGREDIVLSGRFDGVFQHLPSRTFWLWETKTTRSITELLNGLANNLQNYIYLWAMKQMDYLPVRGMLYNILRKAAPTEPKLLQSGFLSQAKNMATTYAAYLDAIKRTHPTFDGRYINEYYGPHLYWLSQQENGFFLRHPIRRNDEELENVMAWVRQIALEMVNPSLPIYPNFNWMACNFCQFRNPCLMTDRGADITSVMQTDYRRKVVSHSFRTSEENRD